MKRALALGARKIAAAAFAAALAQVLALAPRAALAQPTFGTLSNFDVFNDSGQECHGFEIELDGVSAADISFTFGEPYERYDNPKLEDFAGGVYVRYESAYDALNHVFTQATPMAPSVITPTDGHACWTGGTGNYLTSGCEHFGVGTNRNPTATTYRWLIADPASPGSLQPSGTKVSIPAPTWSVAPPQPAANPVVRAVLPAEPPEVGREYGDALWVKVFVTESESDVELHHLVTDDPAVPQEAAETEIEWVLLQAGPPGKGNSELDSGGEIGNGKVSITRRYEFYEYTGAYDPESHEALCGGGGGGGARGGGAGGCETPGEGDLGNYIGAQMAAVNLLDLAATATPTPTETPTPALCVGNCNGDGVVALDELVTLVNIALRVADPGSCAEGMAAGGDVDIAMIVRAVHNALSGCP